MKINVFEFQFILIVHPIYYLNSNSIQIQELNCNFKGTFNSILN